MSLRWVHERVGYDGDLLHGHAIVDYWMPRDRFIRELDRQLAEIRAQMVAERDRLQADTAVMSHPEVSP